MGTSTSRFTTRDGPTAQRGSETEHPTSAEDAPLEIRDVTIEPSTLPELHEAYEGDNDESPTFLDVSNASESDESEEKSAAAEAPGTATTATTSATGLQLIIIKLQMGEYQWSVRKTAADFRRFQRRARMTNSMLPHIKIRRRSDETAQTVREFLTKINTPAYASLKPALMEFLEVSPTSFDSSMERRYKEGYLSTTNPDMAAKDSNCGMRNRSWDSYWFVARESCLMAFKDSKSRYPMHVILFDDGFQYAVTDATTAQTKQGTVLLKTASRLQAADWMLAFRKVRDECAYVRAKHLGSFAPARGSTHIRWLVDGRNAYAAMAEAILAARQEILLTGWWLTPDIPMVREKAHMAQLRNKAAPAAENKQQQQRDQQPSSPMRKEEDELSRRLVRNVVDPLLKLGGTATSHPKGDTDANVCEDSEECEMSLKSLLKECADRGVQVYCQMWKEPPFSMAISSAYQKRLMKELGPTVHVIRHGSLFWTHHEKLLVIDRKLAFVGGIDVAWCRYDTGSHTLEDPDKRYFKHGLEYYNPSYADWMKVEDIWSDRFDRSKYPRMPWHDVHSCMVGPPVQDVVRHFIQRWNFSRTTKNKPSLPVMFPGRKLFQAPANPIKHRRGEWANEMETAAPVRSHDVRATIQAMASDSSMSEQHAQKADDGRQQNSYCAADWAKHWSNCDVQVLRSAGPWSAGTQTECSIYRGYVHAILHSKHMIYMENQYFLSSLGWSDDELAMYEDASTQSELKRHTEPETAPRKDADARWKPKLADVVASANKSAPGKSGAVASAQTTANVQQTKAKSRWAALRTRHASGGSQIFSTVAASPTATSKWGGLRQSLHRKDNLHPIFMLPPSAGAGSRNPSSTSGSQAPSQGLHAAVQAFMEKESKSARAQSTKAASYYRSTPPRRDILKWQPQESSIAEALFARICKAIDKKEQFRVIIVIPIHPDGPIRTVRAIQLVLHWQSRTISRGKTSLLQRLHEKYPDVDLNQYIVFCALRNYGMLSGKAVTEQVYVHSKLLIVDDRVVIIGSANANDRSQYGDRDSECAVMISGGETMDSVMAGKPWKATVFAHTLRRSLWEEHLSIGHSCAVRVTASGTKVPVRTDDNAHFPIIPLRQQLPTRRHGSHISAVEHATSLLQLSDEDANGNGRALNRPTVEVDGDIRADSVATTLLSQNNSDQDTRTDTLSIGGGNSGFRDENHSVKQAEAIPCITPHRHADDAYTNAREEILITLARREKECACDALIDPCADDVYNGLWLASARLNTRIYESVFPGIMQDSIKTLEEWRRRDHESPKDTHLLRLTVGKLVFWPTNFLEDEDLDTKVTEKEHFLPVKVVQ